MKDASVPREWLVTNGIGGYASGVVDGTNTRSYHGLLIAALHPPIGRMVMWSHLFERFNGEPLRVQDFRLELGLPVWRLRAGNAEIERRIFLPHLQNTTVITYQLLRGGDAVALELEPAVDFRKHGPSVEPTLGHTYHLHAHGDAFALQAVESELPALRFEVRDGTVDFQENARVLDGVVYSEERDRGYPEIGQLWTPGVFHVELARGKTIAFIGSTESDALNPTSPALLLAAEQNRRRELLERAGAAANDEFNASLVLAADQFVIRPFGRAESTPDEDADEVTSRTVIAGYHWFTDWGRDTMISFEGLTLTTRRFAEARRILLTFASYVRDGLIPNLFPDGDTEGLYHTADATLWFFHAVARYVRATDDSAMLRELLPTLTGIADAHLSGTRFNIHVDPADGLLVQGAEGYQLTWMDAKVDGWVVTPRRGKAVEINALWYNALMLLAGWLRNASNPTAAPYEEHAARARRSFNRRFWFEEGGHLYDVIDGEAGDDAACRPNQVFAIALDHPVLDEHRWASVLNVVERELLTPVGLRSLSPRHPQYSPTYLGDLRTRDAAYHQGTVWGWLIGPFVGAWLKVHPGRVADSRLFLRGFAQHLDEAGVGSISEIFDADEPHTPRGCIAQAWSIAEVLRCYCASGDGVR